MNVGGAGRHGQKRRCGSKTSASACGAWRGAYGVGGRYRRREGKRGIAARQPLAIFAALYHVLAAAEKIWLMNSTQRGSGVSRA